MAHPVRPHSYIKVRIWKSFPLIICFQKYILPPFPLIYLLLSLCLFFLFFILTDGQLLHRHAIFLELK